MTMTMTMTMLLALVGCASGGGPAASMGNVGLVAGPAPTVVTSTTVVLAGARCAAGSCRCRDPGHDDEESAPPPVGAKRFEIRMSAAGGSASFDLSEVGQVATLPATDDQERDTCAYIDIPAGSLHKAAFVARESTRGQGVLPHLQIAEYGPKGPFWYEVITVRCEGAAGGRCDRTAAESWSVEARQRKRGRLDPCGSAVVSRLAWETSGGQAERDGGLFRDFTARFDLEVKKFATQFAPGSTECLPK